MSGTSSASPENLQVFVKSAGDATDRLDQATSSAAATVNSFYDAPCDPRFRPPGSSEAFGQAKVLVTDNLTTERWIAGIRQAFVDADTNTLPNATLAAMLVKEGINPVAPAALTADEPVYSGAVMYSGWTDDPVSTGAGHFLEVERDLRMPAALSVLTWTRTYGSRYLSDGAHGPGWHCWADTRLDVTRDLVTYLGPDGQVAPFVRSEDGWVRHPAMEGELVTTVDGFDLRWRWTARFPGMIWTFDDVGHLLTIHDPTGGDTTAERRDGRLVGFRHTGGRRLDIRWDEGRVVEVGSSDGRRITFRYADGHLVEVDRPGGGCRYVIGEDHRLAEVFDADGVRLVRNEYDADGRVLAQASPHGRVARYRYSAPYTVVVGDDEAGPATLFRHDAAGRVIELQLADGGRSTRRFDEAGNPVEVIGFDGAITRREFDDRGCSLRQTSTGAEDWTWEYDDRCRVTGTASTTTGPYRLEYDDDSPVPTRIVGPLGGITRLQHSGGLITAVIDADGVETRYERDGDGEVVAVRDGTGGITRYRYHRSGQLAAVETPAGDIRRWEFDGDDRAVAAVGPDGSAFTRTFSPAGRVLDESGPDGGRTAFEWDGAGALVAITDAAGTRRSQELDGSGWVTTSVDGNGHAWQLARDDEGRLHEVIDPSGAAWQLQWHRPDRLAALVDPLAHVRRYEVSLRSDGLDQTVTTPAGRSYRLHWDGLGRFAGGSSDEGPSGCELRYDVEGHPVEWTVDGHAVARAVYTPAGRLAALSRPDGSLWRWSYDRAGRPVAMEGPEGREQIDYDTAGRPVRRVDPTGRVTEVTWDPCGQPAAVRTGGASWRGTYDGWGLLVDERDQSDARRRWHRDPVGRIVAAVDPLGGQVGVVYDREGSVTAMAGAEGQRWGYERDSLGRVVRITDPLGRISQYQYDAAGRATALTLPDGSARVYRWDRDGTLLGIDAVNDTGGQSLLLDVRPEWVTRSVTLSDGDGRRVGIAVDGRDQPVAFDGGGGPGVIDWSQPGSVSVARPDGSVVRADVAASGLPVRFEHPAIGPVALRRDGAGRLLSVEAEGLRRTWRRDAQGDAVEYWEECGGVVRHTRLERDVSGRVVAASEDGVRTTYEYDPAGQLVGTTGDQGAWRWQYDRSGRLIVEESPFGSRSFAYDAADQLSTISGSDGTVASVFYDELGRRVAETAADRGVRYHWDAADRLIGVEVTRPERTRITRIAYDPLGRIVAVDDTPLEWDGAGPFAHQPVRVGAHQTVQLAGVSLAEVDGGQVRWLSADWRGSIGVRRPWGDAHAGDGPPPPAHPELGFLGEIEVEGLVWLRARWYDPATHTFLSPDPWAGSLVMAGGGANPYLYANNDPLQWVDPTGLHPVTAADAAAQMAEWRQGHWKELVVTVGAVLVTTALVVLAPEAVPMLVPVLLGAAGGAGGTVLSDVIQGKPIHWDQVVMDASLGAAVGAGGAFLGGSMSLTGLAARGANALYGSASGASFTGLDRWSTNAPFSVGDELIGAGGGVIGAVAPHTNEEITWKDVTGLTKPQQVRVDVGARDANFYTPRVAAARQLAAKAVAAAKETNLVRDAAFGAVGGLGAGAATPGDPAPPSSTYYPPVAKPALPAVL